MILPVTLIACISAKIVIKGPPLPLTKGSNQKEYSHMSFKWKISYFAEKVASYNYK